MACLLPGYQKETAYLFTKPMKYIGNGRTFHLFTQKETVVSFLD